jgi:hypothetical protein
MYVKDMNTYPGYTELDNYQRFKRRAFLFPKTARRTKPVAAQLSDSNCSGSRPYAIWGATLETAGIDGMHQAGWKKGSWKCGQVWPLLDLRSGYLPIRNIALLFVHFVRRKTEIHRRWQPQVARVAIEMPHRCNSRGLALWENANSLVIGG